MKPRPELKIPTGGAAVWLTDFHNADKSKQCMFVSLADVNVIKSYVMDPSGQATEVGNYSSGGEAPVHATVLYARMRTEGSDPASDVLLVANYHGPDNANTSAGASAASMIINEDCSLVFADRKNHSGSSVIPSRQGGAHVHSFTRAPYGQHDEAYACDLGMDQIFSYAVRGDGMLTLSSTIDTTPGVGPRHMAQRGNQIYVVTEMGMTVNAYNQTECDGKACLVDVQSVSLVPEGQSGDGSKAAEIVMAEDNNTLYASNRGVLNTVTVFGIHSDGTLTQKQQIDAPDYPRGMTLVHGGRVLLVAGQSQTSVRSYTVGSDGTLTQASDLTEGLPPHPAAFMMFEPAAVVV